MKLRVLFTFSIIALQCFSSTAQTLISKQYLKSYPKSYFQGLGVFFANTDVECYKITYTTINPEGELDTASGFISLPKSKTLGYPIAAYHHGTVGSRNEVPSNLSYEHTLPAILTSVGFISIAPDYIGLGTSRGEHPYVHADSEASASKDMLPATLEFLKLEGYKTNKDLFITGYSQGGHAGMALHRLLETEGSDFNLKAASHMSGPYDISTSMKNLLLGDEEYAFVAYAANVALSFNRIYGIFPNNHASDLFIEPYSTYVQRFRNEEIDLWKLNDLMLAELTKNGGKTQPKRMMIPQIVADVTNNPQHPISLALLDNDVYDWKPTIPTRLLYCTADDQVSFNNSLVAESTMKSNGAINVLAQDVSPTSNHTDCVSPAVTNTLFFFLGFYTTTATSEVFENVSVYPNPSSDYINISFDAETATAINESGQMYNLNANGKSLDVTSIPRGTYIIMFDGVNVNGKMRMSKFVKI